MKANYHTHTTWCDGRDTPEDVILAAIGRGFDVIGFSSHAMLPENLLDWVLTPVKAIDYARNIRALARKYRDRIQVLCGVEADYIPGGANPDRATYATVAPDYIIGSIHNVVKDALRCPVDHAPGLLAKGLAEIFAVNLRTVAGWTPELWARVPYADTWERRTALAAESAGKMPSTWWKISRECIKLSAEGLVFWNTVAEALLP